jgi:hypothetical protein
MSKRHWKALGVGIVAILMTAIVTIAPVIFNSPVIAQPQNTANQRVTSISQLTDVEPSAPYFNALQALVERYGCVDLPPDGRFRGDSPLTRGQAAILVHSCLSKFAELIETGVIVPGRAKT